MRSIVYSYRLTLQRLELIMSARKKLFAALTATAMLLLAGCGVVNLQTVEGTVKSVGIYNGDYRIIQFVDNPIAYICKVQEIPACALIKDGETLTLIAGYNENSYQENYVTAIR